MDVYVLCIREMYVHVQTAKRNSNVNTVTEACDAKFSIILNECCGDRDKETGMRVHGSYYLKKDNIDFLRACILQSMHLFILPGNVVCICIYTFIWDDQPVLDGLLWAIRKLWRSHVDKYCSCCIHSSLPSDISCGFDHNDCCPKASKSRVFKRARPEIFSVHGIARAGTQLQNIGILHRFHFNNERNPISIGQTFSRTRQT